MASAVALFAPRRIRCAGLGIRRIGARQFRARLDALKYERLHDLLLGGVGRDFVGKMLDDLRLYRFGYDDQLFRRLIDMHVNRYDEMKDLRFPQHIAFINRTAVGHFGNLSRLRAAAPWRRMLEARLS